MSKLNETIVDVLAEVCHAERLWRDSDEAGDVLLADRMLRAAADKGRRLLQCRAGSVEQFVTQHLED